MKCCPNGCEACACDKSMCSCADREWLEKILKELNKRKEENK